MEWMVDWSGAAEAGAALCGGKGWNLGRLHRYGFPVPVGGVVTAAAYSRFMAAPRLQELVSGVAGMGAREVSSPEAVSRLAAVQAEVAAAELPSSVAAEIEDFLRGAGLGEAAVAVRSSATAEDGEAASFAGIHQSFLNVRGVPAILAAVKRCYASLWTPQAVAYRRHRGLPDSDVACAVVICAMVTRPGAEAPACAGVAFSCDPRTGRRDLITISAAPGLGEGVVSGSVNPEEIAVQTVNGMYSLLSRQGDSCRALGNEQALELARLTDRVHWALGEGQDPQDVEWAHDGDRFWLLQARPVTRLPLVTFPGAARFPVIWSNANLKDAVAGVQATLSWGCIGPLITHVVHSSLPLAGYPVPPGMEVVRRFDGRAYFDLTGLMWAHYDAIGFKPEELVRGLGGHQPLIPVPPGDPFHGPEGARRNRARFRFVLALMREVRHMPRRIADARQKARAQRIRDFAAMSPRELLEVLEAVQQNSTEFGPHFQAANMNAGVWPSMMLQFLERLAPGRGQAIATALLAGSGQVTSAEHGYRLFDLARTAVQEREATAYLLQEPLDPQGWRKLPAGSAFCRECEEFLEEYGHRAVYEGELANPRWREDPAYLLEQVRHLVRTGRTEAPRASAQAARAAADRELARIAWWARPVARWLAAKGQQAAGFREGSKSTIAAIGEGSRLVALETGRRMAAAGLLGAPGDIFHLSRVELEMFLRGEWAGVGARALVADRKARDAAWWAAEPPDCIVLDSGGSGLVDTAPAAAAGADGALTGLGVAAGWAAGVARVIRHPRDGHLLQDGDVLVAPSTDPGWTPLFLRASAVVMEVGGYLSHGAIVAREYGLPAVVNVPGLLSTVRDGQRLVVDGDAGTVRVLEPAAD